MARNIKIKSTKILSDNFFPLKDVRYEYQKKDGSVEEVNREVYQSGNGATALLYNNTTNKVVLIKQFRLPAYLNNHPSGVLIETCAGLLEENEDPRDSIIREIKEETGYEVDNVKKIFELYSTAGSVAELVHYFIAEYSPDQRVSKGGGLEEESEEIEVLELSFEEAYNKVESGEIKDAKTVILLQYAKNNLFQEEKVFDIL
jgi:GDP-mannose pyrophosphatase NudK